MRSLRVVLTSAVVGGLLLSGSAVAATGAIAAPAHASVSVKAAASKVPATRLTIEKISSRTAPYRGKTTVKPRVGASGKISVRSKALTVKHGKKTVAKNKRSVKLAAGTYKVTTRVSYKMYSTRTSGGRTTKVWSSTKSKSLTQKLVIHHGKKPGHTAPISAWNCPSWAPIKGNASSHIYHLPGGRWYTRTKPEICFSSVAAAKHAGYRASKNG